MKDGVVAHALIDKRDVHGGGKLPVDPLELLNEERPLVSQFNQPVGDLAQALDEVWRRQIAVINPLHALLAGSRRLSQRGLPLLLFFHMARLVYERS